MSSNHLSRTTGFALILALVLLTLAMPGLAQSEEDLPEILPAELMQKIEARDELLRLHLPDPEGTLDFFVATTKTWNPGSTVRVAFLGGSPELRREIRDVAQTWVEAGANIVLDFGEEPALRSWSPADRGYSAEVRLFFGDPGDYWSLVGLDAVDPEIRGPGKPTMNLGGFDVAKPSNWKSTVLHEFGHALGLLHEHQSPRGGCRKGYRFKDERVDGKVVPGIYSLLARRHKREEVDRQMRDKPDERMGPTSCGAFDEQSIMKYSFPDTYCREGFEHCCSGPNLELSDQDRRCIQRVYPLQPAAVRAALRKRLAFYRDVERASGLPHAMKSAYRERLVDTLGQYLKLPH